MKKLNPLITTRENITLVRISNIPASVGFVGDVFENIALLNIDVDMIAVAVTQTMRTELSFTVNDEKLIKTVSYISKLQNGSIKPVVNSGNCIISIYDENMDNCPGVAASVFKCIADANAEIILVTTSETQISLLVSRADFENVFAAVKGVFYG